MENFQNPPEAEIKALLQSVRTIAMVGLSPRPNRPSHRVATQMQRFGYRIIPVRPAVDAVLGQKAYPSLGAVPDKIELVDVFRAPEHVDAIVDECIALDLPALWLQDGVVNVAAARRARDAGMLVVMDRCVYRDYLRLFGPVPHS
ncbi:MAG TPA: CoA-binding protein [Candidatus Methylomirabilis sp.]|nr:CoA-binding protein [Candidatus Methylomirabilis sp.]